MRRLLITHRSVETAGTAAYDDAWKRVRSSVEAVGGRAWRFRHGGAPKRYIEFIEWTGPTPVPESEAVAAERARLDQAGSGSSETWEEAPA